MCGICGIAGVEDRSQIQKMLSVLKHRGPDSSGIYLNKDISLGHARLSIIDLSEKGNQPMSNENGDVWLAVNGEIYNYRELKAELEGLGHSFRSNSDSEVIVHLYEQYDLDFIARLRGMFAFALYDQQKNLLILARDPIGKKPLYYHCRDNELIFASEIKAILECNESRPISESALWTYLAYGYTIGQNTLFAGIKKLLPGHILLYSNGKLLSRKYWDIHGVESYPANEDRVIESLKAQLEDATAIRMNADVPIGAFLSGGLDSSAVVALARPYVDNTFHTFSVGFEERSELEYAKIVSEHVGTEHHEIIIDDKMVADHIKSIAWYNDEPLGDAATINNYFLSKEAKKYVTVVLAGEGGDEIFAGYSHHIRNCKLYEILRKHPSLQTVARSILRSFPEKITPSMFSPINQGLRYIKSFDEDSIEKITQNSTKVLSDHEIEDLTSLKRIEANAYAIYPEFGFRNTLSKILIMDCKNLLPEKFLMKADKGTMANSIEERLPLLDKNIIQFAFSSIPPYLKYKENCEKYVFRMAVKDQLPLSIVHRKKEGFGTPLNAWMRGELNELVIQAISEGALLTQILRKNRQKELVNFWQGKRKTNTTLLWELFALELWHDVYFQDYPVIFE
jgi:asparagine synthase (glutamine-hydrolysing)